MRQAWPGSQDASTPIAPQGRQRVPGGAAAPSDAAGGWACVAVPARAASEHRRRAPLPIVVAVSHGARARSWAFDPGLVWIAGLALGAVGLCALDRLLVALLYRLL